MNAQFYQQQIATVIEQVKQGKGDEHHEMTTIDVASVSSESRLAKEKAMFKQLPLLVAHASELKDNGSYVVRELDGRSWLLVRGDDGVARAFYNYCQHRGTKLEHDQKGCKKRFSCPYHSWTYGTNGQLIGVPRADLFPGLDKSKKGLKQADCQEAFGFLWLIQDRDVAPDVNDFLAPLVSEFDALDLGAHHVYFDKTRALKSNWKHPLFAFLEPYHIGTLHRDSIADFFVKNVAHTEHLTPHIRSFVPRKNVLELEGVDLSERNIAEYITPTNILFPNVCMIAHPTSYSVISLFPGDTPGTATWRHMLLVPELPKTEKERAHYDKTVAVLDGVTYKSEDFWVSEQLQEGINAGALEELVLAKNEWMIKVFDETVESYLK